MKNSQHQKGFCLAGKVGPFHGLLATLVKHSARFQTGNRRWRAHAKATFTLGCVLILTNAPTSHAQRLKWGEPNYKQLSEIASDIGWYQLTATKAWAVKDDATMGLKGARCMHTLDELRTAGVPDIRTIDVKYDAPEFPRGSHTLAEIRASCEHVESLGKIKYFEKWAVMAMQDTPNLDSGRYETGYFKNCIQTYDEIVKAGVSPTERVPDRVIGSTVWSGSIEELRNKWCEPGLSRANAKTAASEEPYRKELTSDKLRVALTYQEILLPGGARTSDPHKMAAASVWFVDFSPSKICSDGRQVHNLRRYQFRNDQRLVKTTEQDYCGSAPLSAFR